MEIIIYILCNFTIERGITVDRIDERIKIVKDDLIKINVDAIVNPTDINFSGSEGDRKSVV